MAIRTIRIQADEVIETLDGELEVVSREALIAAAVDLAITINMSGGTGTIVTTRAPTGVPNEMVTVGAMVQWKDRTDAKPQPEEHEGALVAAVPAPAVETPGVFVAGEFVPAQPQVPVHVDNPDGFDRSALEEEDMSSIPVEARG